MQGREIILSVRNLSIEFFTKSDVNIAVDEVSFELEKGKVLGIVGASGSGKSTIGNAVIGLLNKRYARVTKGEIIYKSKNLLSLSDKELTHIRGNEIAMIFQNPSTALDPIFSIGEQIIEAIRLHEDISYKEARKKAIDLLGEVGISSPEERMDQYPHEFAYV